MRVHRSRALRRACTGDRTVDNDATFELLRAHRRQSRPRRRRHGRPLGHDGRRVGAIRAELDAEGFAETPILAYAAKFASAFYGPFREAAASTPAFGDRRSYQMDPGNGREAVREALLDVAEGADMLMVKPALAYGDLIARRQARDQPAGRRLQRQRRVRDGQGRGGRWPAGRAGGGM